jgi:hypothetical protein
MAKPKIKSDGRTITVRVPISIRKRGGRKVVLAPDGMQRDPRALWCQQIDNAMVKAIARAMRWRELLEKGTYSTVVEIADNEQINESYVSRLLRLTLLAPDIVEAILDGTQPPKLILATLMRRRPITWGDQRTTLGRVAGQPEKQSRRKKAIFREELARHESPSVQQRSNSASFDTPDSSSKT